MKNFALKSLLSVALLSLFVVSCSDDPASTVATEVVDNYALIKETDSKGNTTEYVYNSDKLIHTSTMKDGLGTVKDEYVYEGTKLMSIKRTDERTDVGSGSVTETTFTYEGENITKQEDVTTSSSSSSIFKRKKTFTYEGSNLKTYAEYNNVGMPNELISTETRIISRDGNNITSYETHQNKKTGNEGEYAFEKIRNATLTYEAQKNYLTANFSAAYKKIQTDDIYQSSVPLKTVETSEATGDSTITEYANTYVSGRWAATTYVFEGKTNGYTYEYTQL